MNQPRTTVRKAGLDIVTATDKESEAAVVAVISAAFPGHAILGEEGGVTGPVSSDYLWCVGPWYFQAVWVTMILNVNIFRLNPARYKSQSQVPFEGLPSMNASLPCALHSQGAVTTGSEMFSLQQARKHHVHTQLVGATTLKLGIQAFPYLLSGPTDQF